MQIRVVARYLDGRVPKGTTADFNPTRPLFHVVVPLQGSGAAQSLEIKVADLKAAFCVKDLIGDAAYNEFKAFAPDVKAAGRKIKVECRDGETVVGTTQGYQPDRPGFFVVPVDPKVEQRPLLRGDGGREERQLPVAQGFSPAPSGQT